MFKKDVAAANLKRGVIRSTHLYAPRLLPINESKEIPEEIKMKVAEGLAVLAPHLRDWLRDHLVDPYQIRFSVDTDGKSFRDLWLVTDHVGGKDSSYRIVYDEIEQSFGLECTLESGVEWYMGIYGSFSETVENM